MSAAAELPTRITQGGGVHFHPSWSPDGLRVVFVSEESGNYRIEQVSVTNGRPAGAPRAVASMRSMPMSPVWSADGSEIAYVMNSEIWMTAADGSGASRQVTSGADVERLRWNRVTGRLYASGLWNANEVSVRLVDPRSGESRPLPFPLRLGSTRTYVDFDVALDETLAAIDREDLKGDIWVLDSRPHSY